MPHDFHKMHIQAYGLNTYLRFYTILGNKGNSAKVTQESSTAPVFLEENWALLCEFCGTANKDTLPELLRY